MALIDRMEQGKAFTINLSSPDEVPAEQGDKGYNPTPLIPMPDDENLCISSGMLVDCLVMPALLDSCLTYLLYLLYLLHLLYLPPP